MIVPDKSFLTRGESRRPNRKTSGTGSRRAPRHHRLILPPGSWKDMLNQVTNVRQRLSIGRKVAGRS
jgi:hypothetical protein